MWRKMKTSTFSPPHWQPFPSRGKASSLNSVQPLCTFRRDLSKWKFCKCSIMPNTTVQQCNWSATSDLSPLHPFKNTAVFRPQCFLVSGSCSLLSFLKHKTDPRYSEDPLIILSPDYFSSEVQCGQRTAFTGISEQQYGHSFVVGAVAAASSASLFSSEP